jgi:hypothetical protein
METIAQAVVTAGALWPNASPDSEWHTRKTNRQFMIELKRTKRGEFFVVATPRNPLAHTFTPRTNAIATEAEARDIAHDLLLFMRNDYQGEFTAPRWTHAPKRVEAICPDCEGIGTITTTQEAYGDRSVCNTEGCGYTHWYSIGD